ncbi:MAG: phosphatase PAP2 family protein [Chitinophagaceae bacterium]|nr:MAG: phosphatase PAP2 family protein [Chitinophagaceae bacterium]
MKKILNTGSLLVCVIIVFLACKKNDPFPRPAPEHHSDVATEWMKMQMRLTMSTPGFNSIVAGRSFGYSGLTLYEAVVPGLPQAKSLAEQLNGGNALKLLLPNADKHSYYAPASVNAAMAAIIRSLFGNTSPANLKSVDSLEESFKAGFAAKAGNKNLAESAWFGKKLASAIFEWSKTDGGHEAYLHVTSPSYIPPTGPGKWIPTPPAFGAPIHPGWGSNRSFIPGVPGIAAAPAPMEYSEQTNSAYYQQALELYNLSQKLTKEDTTIVRFWADLPVNYNVPAHATGILNQLIILKKFNLNEAALAYVQHGFALSDAVLTVFKGKYTYNTKRPVSYIRSVLNHPQWNTVIPTPPHPEYPAAHALVSAASAAVMENLFGKYLNFTDHTYDNLYGARTFKSFDEYAKEAGHSRVLGGIHYPSSVKLGLELGKKVGDAVVDLNYNNNSNHHKSFD